MEGAPKLHVKPMQKANAQPELHRPKFGVAARLAGLAITTALILSPLNFAMGQDNKTDTATQKKDSKKVEEKAPPQIIAARLDTTLDKKGAVPSQTKAIAEDKDKKPAMLAKADAKGKVLLAQAGQTNGEYVYGQGQEVDFNSLPTVSFDYLSERYGATREIFLIQKTSEKGIQYLLVQGEPTSKEMVVLIVYIGLDKNNNMDYNHVEIGLKTEKGVAKVEEKLDELARLYHEATGGKQMRSVSLTAETDYVDGKWLVNFIIVPLEDRLKPVTPNTPCLYIPYYNGEVYLPAVKMIR